MTTTTIRGNSHLLKVDGNQVSVSANLIADIFAYHLTKENLDASLFPDCIQIIDLHFIDAPRLKRACDAIGIPYWCSDYDIHRTSDYFMGEPKLIRIVLKDLPKLLYYCEDQGWITIKLVP